MHGPVVVLVLTENVVINVEVEVKLWNVGLSIDVAWTYQFVMEEVTMNLNERGLQVAGVYQETERLGQIGYIYQVLLLCQKAFSHLLWCECEGLLSVAIDLL